jgi:hypothetical protein
LPPGIVALEVSVALMAVAFPILPGKTADWQSFIDELNGPRRADFADSRRRLGVQERTFLQPTPMGDLVIVTLEGENPARSFGQFVHSTDEFTLWFMERVKAVHGIDLTTQTAPPPELVIDSNRPAVLAK